MAVLPCLIHQPGFLAAGVPLFFAGAALCYWILPKATKLLLGFTPEDVRSIVDVHIYVWEPEDDRWRPLSFAEKKAFWAFRDR